MKTNRWTIDENDTLYDNWEYFTKNKEIAEITFSRSWDAIRIHACSLGVKRTINHLTSNPAILNEARDYLDGLLLSDGNIRSPESNITSLYQHDCKHKGWLDTISNNFWIYNIKCSVDNGQLKTGRFCSEEGSIAYMLQSSRYVEFKEMHDRWYKKGYNIDEYPIRLWHLDKETGEWFVWKKIVPKDICLSRECVANWYLGDGGTYKQSHGDSYFTLISTEGFLRNDTIFLADLLSDILDIKCGVNKAGVIGIYTQADISTFLNYIKNYEIDCYYKKFPEELINHGI